MNVERTLLNRNTAFSTRLVPGLCRNLRASCGDDTAFAQGSGHKQWHGPFCGRRSAGATVKLIFLPGTRRSAPYGERRAESINDAKSNQSLMWLSLGRFLPKPGSACYVEPNRTSARSVQSASPEFLLRRRGHGGQELLIANFRTRAERLRCRILALPLNGVKIRDLRSASQVSRPRQRVSLVLRRARGWNKSARWRIIKRSHWRPDGRSTSPDAVQSSFVDL